MSAGRTVTLTALAVVSFASNSLLCRAALGHGAIDAVSFSTVRIVAGAAMLLVLANIGSASDSQTAGSWTSALVMFLYAIPFAIAYVSLTTGTGALLLFGSVQVTMLIAAVISGTRPHPLQWMGLVCAAAGLVYLTLPGLAAPDLVGAIMMITAGIAWGVYSLRGRGAANPLAQTTSNFVKALPMTLVVSIVAFSWFHAEPRGIVLAAVSGAITSGLGYVVWYAALRGLSAFRAAVVQLPVPVIAAAGGVAFLGETISPRLIVASGLVLGGIAMALIGREQLVARG